MVAFAKSSKLLKKLYLDFFRYREPLRLKAFSWIPFGINWLLDVGCKEGTITALYGTKAARVCGVDINFQALIQGKRDYPDINFILADASKLPFKKKSFDIIVSTESVQYMKDPETFLDGLGSLLKFNNRKAPKVILSVPSGGYFSTVFNPDNLQTWWLSSKKKKTTPGFPVVKRRARHFSLGQMEGLIAKWGRMEKYYRSGSVLYAFYPLLMEILIDRLDSARWIHLKPDGFLKTLEKGILSCLDRYAQKILHLCQLLMVYDFHVTFGNYSYILLVSVKRNFP